METPTTEDDVNVRTPLLRAANNHRVQAINGSIEELVDDRRHSTLTSSAVSSLGFFAVVFLTVNATLGAGLLNIPYAFSQSGGILPASVAQLVSRCNVWLSFVDTYFHLSLVSLVSTDPRHTLPTHTKCLLRGLPG